MSETGGRLRVLFEGIAPPIDIAAVMTDERIVPSRRRGMLIAVTAAAVALVVGLGGWYLVGRRGAEPPVITTPPAVTSTTVDSSTTTATAGFTTRPLTPTGVEVTAPSDGTFLEVSADPAGSVWALGNAGLTRFDPSTGDVRVWTIADDESLANLAGLAPAREAGVWLWWWPEGSLGSRVGRFEGGTSIQLIEAPGAVLGVAEATDGTLWAAVDGLGVLRWDGSAWTNTAITRVGSGVLLVADDSGGVWVSSAAAPPLPATLDLWHFDGDGWASYAYRDFEPAPGAIKAVVPLPSGGVLLGGNARWQLQMLDRGAWTGLPVPELAGDRGSAAVTDDGDIWVSVSSDFTGRMQAARLRGGTWTTFGAEEGLPAQGGWTMEALAVTDNEVFLATGSALLQFVDDRWVEVLAESRPDSPAYLDVMLALSHDELWGAEWIDAWHYIDGAWHRYGSADGLPPEAGIRDLALGPAGTVWAATDGGVAYFADQRWVVVDEEPAWAVAASPDGTVWAGRSGFNAGGDPGTMVVFEPVEDTWEVARVVEHPLDVVDSLAVGTDGSVWIASHGTGYTLPGRGLARFNGTDWEVIDHLGAYPIEMVGDLAVAPDGDIWTIVVSEHDGTPLVIQYDGQEWIRHDAVLEGAGFDLNHRVWVEPDGTVCVPAPGGLATFDGAVWTVREGEWWGAVSVAPDGTVWISGSQGVMRLPTG